MRKKWNATNCSANSNLGMICAFIYSPTVQHMVKTYYTESRFTEKCTQTLGAEAMWQQSNMLSSMNVCMYL